MVAIPMNWRVVMVSLKKKYPTLVIQSVESAIQIILVIAIPSYCNDRAKKKPASANAKTVAARNAGCFVICQYLAETIAIVSSNATMVMYVINILNYANSVFSSVNG